jgi:hypothetical protein
MKWMRVNCQSQSNLDFDFDLKPVSLDRVWRKADQFESGAVWDSCPYRRRRSPHCCKLLHNNTEPSCEIGASRQGHKLLNMEAEGFIAMEAIIRQLATTQQTENLVRAVVYCGVCELAIALWLFVVMICNPITSPNIIYCHLLCDKTFSPTKIPKYHPTMRIKHFSFSQVCYPYFYSYLYFVCLSESTLCLCH